jgi:hypothetical protein
MTIQYKLFENHLPNGADSYRARVAYNRVVDLDGVIETMDYRSSSITRADMLAVLEDFHQALLMLLWEGTKVVTPFGVYGLTVKGHFESTLDRFDARRHRLEITTKPGQRLQQEFARKARAKKKKAIRPNPIPECYRNLADSEVDGILTPGRMAQVTGHRLKFDPDDPEQGLFLIPARNGDQITPPGPAIRITDIARNKGRELIFMVPAHLPVGAYVLEVRALFGQHSLRSGRLEEKLIVP